MAIPAPSRFALGDLSPPPDSSYLGAEVPGRIRQTPNGLIKNARESSVDKKLNETVSTATLLKSVSELPVEASFNLSRKGADLFKEFGMLGIN